MIVTSNLKLKKPEYTDVVDIAILNENTDILEAQVPNKVDKSQIKNNLTETVAGNVLDASQGTVLKGLVDGKAPTVHKHTTNQIDGLHNSAISGDATSVNGHVFKWEFGTGQPTHLWGHNASSSGAGVQQVWNPMSVKVGSCENADKVGGKTIWDFVHTTGMTMANSGANIKFPTSGGNSENGIVGGTADAASFGGCNMDLFSWNGIGFYPTAGGAWGNGPSGRSVIIDTRNGYVKARGGFEAQGRNLLSEIDALKASGGGIRRVQRGVTNIASSVNITNVGIATVDLNKSFVTITHDGLTAGDYQRSEPLCYFANSSTLTMGASNFWGNISWEVVEFS